METEQVGYSQGLEKQDDCREVCPLDLGDCGGEELKQCPTSWLKYIKEI